MLPKMNLFSRITKDLSTESDGESFDIVKVMMILGCFVLFFGVIYAMVVKGAPFSPTEFSIGLTTILAGGSAGIRIKETTDQKNITMTNVGSPAP